MALITIDDIEVFKKAFGHFVNALPRGNHHRNIVHLFFTCERLIGGQSPKGFHFLHVVGGAISMQEFVKPRLVVVDTFSP